MKTTGRILRAGRFTVLAMAIALTVCSTAAVFAEPHVEIDEIRDGVSTRWIQRAAGFAPYTELSAGESAALSTAVDALTEPPLGLIRNADHGYEQCELKLEAIRSLGYAEPLIVGHELLMANDTCQARVFVYADGPVELLSCGAADAEADTLRALSGAGEFDAAELACKTFAVHEGLATDSSFCDMSAGLEAYGVGFANADGVHVVMRVTPDGLVSCPEW